MTSARNRRNGKFTAIGVAGLACAAAGLAVDVSSAQDGKAIIMKNDGAAPMIAMFDHVDFADLRTPDFVKRDLPTFDKKLVLSDEQLAAVERQLDAYLEAFKKLAEEHLPKKHEGPMAFRLGGGEAGEGGEPGIFLGLEEGELPEGLELGELEGEFPEGLGVDVNVQVGAQITEGEEQGGEGAGDDDGGPAVAIKIATPDGQELPEEVRKQLEEKAAKMAEEIKRKVEAQLAEGGEPGALPLLGGNLPSIEEMKARNEEMQAKAEAFREAKAQLRSEFVLEVQTSTLAPAQVERWPALERALLRSKSLPKGRLSGERTDLLKVLDELELNEAEADALGEQMEAYELAMDSALRHRNQFVGDAHSKVNKAMQANDPDKALSIIDRATDLRLAVRNLNLQFMETMGSMLPKERAEAFRASALRASYPRVYGRSFGQRVFAAAKKLEGLEQDALEQIVDLERAYGAELDVVNAQIKQAIDRHEPSESRRPIEHMKEMMERRGDDMPGMVFMERDERGPIDQAMQRRRDLDSRYLNLIKGMLSAEQAAQLPKAPARRTMEPVLIELPSQAQ